tara:strand:+ start:378 stop:767 length:390 start_codon:yes stop_codon:yes gene_type:complete
MTEKKRRGRPRKQPIDDLGYITVNDRKVALGVKAGNNVTTGNDNVVVGVTSDGSSADYYKLPANAKELQDLISHKNMNAQIGEIFRSCYRYGESSHSDELRDAKKIEFYIKAEIKRLEKGNEKRRGKRV